MPFFSIIIAAYNLRNYIGDCLSSIQVQTFSDFEVIAVDDGSSDGTADVIENSAARDPRIRLIRKSNGGVSSARNEGLKFASGKYIWFIDGDDYIHPESLARLREIFLSRPELDYIQFLYYYTRTRYADAEFSPELRLNIRSEYSGDRPDDFRQMLSFSPIACCCMCMRADRIGGIRFLPICTSEDALFALQITYQCRHTVLLEGDSIYHVYLRPDSFSRQKYTTRIYSDYLTFSRTLLQLKGTRDGWGDPILAFSLVRFNFPYLMKRIKSLSTQEESAWAWKEFLDLAKQTTTVFPEGVPRYFRWIAHTRSYILAWFFLRLRYQIRDFILAHKGFHRFYLGCKNIVFGKSSSL